jgi:hypothetical protein
MGKVIAMPVKENKPPEVKNHLLMSEDINFGLSSHHRALWQEDYLISYFGVVYTIPAADYISKRQLYDVDVSTLLCPLGDEWTPLDNPIVERIEMTDLQTGDVIVMLRIPFRNMKVNKRGEQL